jgi:dephospho-CoA kinase
MGLTGSIGMGKSTVAAMFAEAGVPVFDADAEVHRLQGPGGALVAAIEAEFPDTTSDLGVNRTLLREAVIGRSHEAFARLEAIVHPAVARGARIVPGGACRAPLVVLDVPLLFEAGGWRHVDKIAVVSAPAEIQRERVLARPGMTAARFEAILARSCPTRRSALAPISSFPPASRSRRRVPQVRDVIACLADRAGG